MKGEEVVTEFNNGEAGGTNNGKGVLRYELQVRYEHIFITAIEGQSKIFEFNHNYI